MVIGGVLLLLLGIAVLWLKRDVIQGTWLYHAVSYEVAGSSIWIRGAVFAFACVWILLFTLLIPNRKIWIFSGLGQYTLPVFLLHGFLVRLLGKIVFFHWSECGNILVAFLLAFLICFALGNKWVTKALAFTFSGGWLRNLYTSHKGRR